MGKGLAIACKVKLLAATDENQRQSAHPKENQRGRLRYDQVNRGTSLVVRVWLRIGKTAELGAVVFPSASGNSRAR